MLSKQGYSPGASSGAAAGANPGQPQLKMKAIPAIAKMEEAKRQIRKPQARQQPMLVGGSGREPGMGIRKMVPPMPPSPAGGVAPAAPGGAMDEQAMIAALPPRIRAAVETGQRDPQEAMRSALANRPAFAARMAGGMPPSAPGGPPAGNSGIQDVSSDMASVEPVPGSAPPLPPGAEPGGMSFIGRQRQPAPPGMRTAVADPVSAFGAGGQAGGFNPGSLQDLYTQLMPQGRRPPQYGGGMGGGANPFMAYR